MPTKRKSTDKSVKPWQDEEELSEAIDDDDEQWIADMVTYMKSCSASLKDIRDLIKDFGSLLHELNTLSPAKKPNNQKP